MFNGFKSMKSDNFVCDDEVHIDSTKNYKYCLSPVLY